MINITKDRAVNPFRVTLAVPEKAFVLTLDLVFFDRCAFSTSLYLPPAALGLKATSRKLKLLLRRAVEGARIRSAST